MPSIWDREVLQLGMYDVDLCNAIVKHHQKAVNRARNLAVRCCSAACYFARVFLVCIPASKHTGDKGVDGLLRKFHACEGIMRLQIIWFD